MRLVLDANVLIAAFVARGLCADVLEHCIREHTPVASPAILDEVHRNLVAKIRVSDRDANAAVRLLRERLELFEPVALAAPVCRDPDDDVVLGTTVAAGADAIVTGDRELLDLGTFQAMRILSPRTFWTLASGA